MSISQEIKSQIASNHIIIYMKGSPQFPQCGFSSRAVQVLKELGAEFAYVDVLTNPDVRAELPKVSNWPTFPQLFIGGELIGGSDIVLELYQSGELQKLLESTLNSTNEEE